MMVTPGIRGADWDPPLTATTLIEFYWRLKRIICQTAKTLSVTLVLLFRPSVRGRGEKKSSGPKRLTIRPVEGGAYVLASSIKCHKMISYILLIDILCRCVSKTSKKKRHAGFSCFS